MSKQDEIAAHPEFPWLSLDEPDGIVSFLHSRGWLEAGEQVVSCTKAGEGNMNLTIRVTTDRRSLILKQARPWVEKYDQIPAPWDRILFEQRFYQRVQSIRTVADHMPGLLDVDVEGRAMLLEDLTGAVDLTTLYAPRPITAGQLESLTDYLSALHESTFERPNPTLANREMRTLNHQHIFQIPLAEDNGIELEQFEPGLSRVAAELREREPYMALVKETGERYLADGWCLVHGDYFPGSWLAANGKVWVIDPEFCFYGDAEFDLGCAVAHLALAAQEVESAARMLSRYQAQSSCITVEPEWVARFAATEVMRRLIGVAQLPIPATDGFRANLLARSAEAMLSQTWEPLWN